MESNKFENFAFLYKCAFKIAEEGEQFEEYRLVNAPDRSWATRMIRRHYKKSGLKLIRFIDHTI